MGAYSKIRNSKKLICIALFFKENNKLIKILKKTRVENLATLYLRKSNRELFVNDNNIKVWEKANCDIREILMKISLENRSITYKIQQIILVQLLLESTKNSVGKVIEVGTYKGGTAVLFRRVLDQFSRAGDVIVFDTFTGHPHVDKGVDLHLKSQFAQKNMAATLDYLDSNNVKYIIGDVIETFNFHKYAGEISFLHLDVDLYQVTRLFLSNLSKIIKEGGICVIDDFGKPSCPGIERAFTEVKADLDKNFISIIPMTYQLVLLRK